jgi:hypothetical protein
MTHPNKGATMTRQDRIALLLSMLALAAAATPASAQAFAGVGTVAPAAAHHKAKHHATPKRHATNRSEPYCHVGVNTTPCSGGTLFCELSYKSGQESKTCKTAAEQKAAIDTELKRECEAQVNEEIGRGGEISPLAPACASVDVSLPAPYGRA